MSNATLVTTTFFSINIIASLILIYAVHGMYKNYHDRCYDKTLYSPKHTNALAIAVLLFIVGYLNLKVWKSV